MHRVGIIPFSIKDNMTAIMFVTSMTRGRWILPKGLAEEGESHNDTCHREGFEEAGIRGVVLKDFPMTVIISKKSKTGLKTVPVTYYPFLVQEQVDVWPESAKRQRHWALLEDTSKVVHRNDFLRLLKQFESLCPWVRKAAEQYISQPQDQLQPAQ